MKKEFKPKYYCDRCGDEIEEYEENNAKIVYWENISITTNMLDLLFGTNYLREKCIMELCYKCKEKLIKFLNTKEND